MQLVALIFAVFFSVNVAAKPTQRIKAQPGDRVQVDGPAEIVIEPAVKHPVITKRCISNSLGGECREHELTYAVAGVSCTEDCVKVAPSGFCRVASKCSFDQASGCFKKRVCVVFSPADYCNEWEETVICN